MRRFPFPVLVLLFLFSLAGRAAFGEEVSVSTIEIPGTDRSLVSPLPPTGIVPFELEKDIRVSVRPIDSPFSLGPFSVWSRLAIGDDDSWCLGLVTGVATGDLVGDLRGYYRTRPGARPTETEETGDGSLLLDYRFDSGVRLRLSSSYLIGRYDLLGPDGAPSPELTRRTDDGQSFDFRAGYTLGGGTDLLVGVFYDDFEVERASHYASERRTGVSVLLSDEEKTLSLRLWKRAFSGAKGDSDDVFASLEMRDDYLIRSGSFSVGTVFGAHLAGESRVVIAPKLTIGWLVNPRFRLAGELGVSCRVPSLDSDLTGSPRVDPWRSPPSVVTSFLASVSAHVAFAASVSVTASVSWRSASDELYAETGPDGYLLFHAMEDADFLSISVSAETNPLSFLRFRTSLSWTSADTGAPARHFPYLPEWRGSARVTLSMSERLSLSLGAHFSGRQYVSAFSDERIGGFTLFDCELSYTVESYLRFFLRAENVGDKDYEVRENWPGRGSWFLVGVEIRF